MASVPLAVHVYLLVGVTVPAAFTACRAVPLMMTDHEATAAMAAAAVDLVAG